ncbi:hypothetical protein Tco_0755969 [Tanacetum coccineum]
MMVVPPPMTYEVGGPSTVAAEGHPSVFMTPGAVVPPLVIDDLCICMGNLKYGHGTLVKKVIGVSDAEVANSIAIREMGPMISTIEGQPTDVDATCSSAGEKPADSSALDPTSRGGESIHVLELETFMVGCTGCGTMDCNFRGFLDAFVMPPDTKRPDTDTKKGSSWGHKVFEEDEREDGDTEVEGEEWRRLFLHQTRDAIEEATESRKEDFFPRNGR